MFMQGLLAWFPYLYLLSTNLLFLQIIIHLLSWKFRVDFVWYYENIFSVLQELKIIFKSHNVDNGSTQWLVGGGVKRGIPVYFLLIFVIVSKQRIRMEQNKDLQGLTSVFVW